MTPGCSCPSTWDESDATEWGASEPGLVHREAQASAVGDGSGLSGHILPNAANLVGVCIMALSLVKLLPRHGWSASVDKMLAGASVIFLISVAYSYASLRISRHSGKALEVWAERVFLLGLGIIIVSATILAFDIT
jgi:hypothetical protein